MQHRIIVVSEFIGGSGAPIGTLVSDLIRHLRDRTNIEVKVLKAPGRYKPGGFAPVRIRNLILLHMVLPFYLVIQKLLAGIEKSELRVLVLTSPPLIQWMAGIMGFFLRIPVTLWYQDAHPELEARILEQRKFSTIPKLLRFVDKRLLRLIDSIITLDNAMRAQLLESAAYPRKIHVVPPWATFVDPRKSLRTPREDPLKMIYAGNYGAAHDLNPLGTSLAVLPESEQQKYSLTFTGMNEMSQARVRRIFEKTACDLTFIPRFDRLEDLLKVFDDFDFGLVSLHHAYLGLCCPSKAFTYVSQGLPIFYVGPEKTLSWQLCRQGWGITHEQWFGDKKGSALANLKKNAGLTLDNPGDTAPSQICAALLEKSMLGDDLKVFGDPPQHSQKHL